MSLCSIPVFDGLRRREKSFFVTAGNFAQIKDLLDTFEADYSLIREHGGKNKVKKAMNLIDRAFVFGR